MARRGKKSNSCMVWVEKHEGRRAFGKPRRKLKNNIKIYLKGTGWECMGWIKLAQDSDTGELL